MLVTISKSKRQIMADRELPISHYIPISHLNSPTIFETKNGAQGCVIAVQGCPFEVKDQADLNWNQRMVGNFLLSLSDEFAVYITQCRRKHNVYPAGDFPNGFARNFDVAYRTTFAQKSLYVNDFYVTLMIKGATHKVGKNIHRIQRLLNRHVESSLNAFREKQQKKLQKAIAHALKSLENFMPRLLGEKESLCGKQSELLSFFSILINGEKRNFLYPKQDIASYLPTRRLSFGHHTLEWQGNCAKDQQLAALISVKQYGPDSASPMLDPLLKVDFEYVNTHSFLRQDNPVAMDLMRRQSKHLLDAKDASFSQQDAIVEAMDLLASGHLVFGLHHNTILILANTSEELEEHVATITKIYRDTDMVVVRESLNLESAFWAQLPGNFSYIRRSAMISSNNFADFAPLHNYHHGYLDENHLGSALMLVESSSRTPLYINFHERASGKKNDLSKGHTTLIAPSNAGKTTLLNAMNAQSQKYGGTSFFFDRDRGCEIYVRAMDGFYTHINPEQPTRFNPLTLPDTPSHRDFLTKWLASLLAGADEELPAMALKQVEEVIHRSYTLPEQKRNLSVVSSFFPSDFSHFEHLLPWLRSFDPQRPDGRLAYLFDNDEDNLHIDQQIAGFDMTHLLDKESPGVIFSVMFYLFHRIESIMDGRLIGIYLDEGWQLFENSYWRTKIRKYLATLRKANAYIVFATQSPSTVAKSSLRDALIEGTATNIFLPNPKAEESDYRDGFKLSQREYEFIKSTDPRERRFLIKQGHEAAIGRLNLAGLEDYVAVLSANTQTVELLDEICFEVGHDPADWLPIFQQRRPR